MVDYIVAICGFLTAVFTFAMAYFQWCNLTRNKPAVSAHTRDLPYAAHRGHREEGLQKQGFCCLDVSVTPTSEDYTYKSIEIPHCQITSPILNFDGTLAKQSEGRMTHGSVPFKATARANDSGFAFSLLIKPDAQEEANLVLIIRGPFFSSIRVPFCYKKTHYIGE